MSKKLPDHLQADEVRRYPDRYRDAIAKVFTKFVCSDEGKEIGTPKKIIQEFASYTEENFTILYGRYERNIESIKRGRKPPQDDMALYYLLERFVWNYVPEEIANLVIKRDMHELGHRLHEWHDSGRKKEITKDNVAKQFSPEYIDDNQMYALQGGVGYEISEIPEVFLAIKKIEEEPFDFAVMYCEPPPRNLFLGIYLRNIKTFFLREAITKHACTMSPTTMATGDHFITMCNYPISKFGRFPSSYSFAVPACLGEIISHDQEANIKIAKEIFSTLDKYLFHIYEEKS